VPILGTRCAILHRNKANAIAKEVAATSQKQKKSRNPVTAAEGSFCAKELKTKYFE
jgi:hypothetical protein